MELIISIHVQFYRSGEQSIELKVGDSHSRYFIVLSNTLLKVYKPSLTANIMFYKMISGWFTHSKIRMATSYIHEVWSGKGAFIRLLDRWKGSVYKLVWREMLVYVSIYTALSLIYRFQLSEEGKLVIMISLPFRFKRELILNI